MEEKHTYRPTDTSGKSLPEALRVNPYTVPDGYFANLQKYTLQQCLSIEEAQQAWRVPSGYFDQLSDRIFAKIKEQQLKETISEPGFSVPEGYFNRLENQFLLEKNLGGYATEPGFSVPAAYFETLQKNIAGKTYQRQDAPIRKISRPQWITYAAAACIALAVSIFGVIKLTIENPSTTSGHLASVSDQEILSYLELYGTDDDVMYISEQLDDFDERVIGEEISEEDIEAYLNHTL